MKPDLIFIAIVGGAALLSLAPNGYLVAIGIVLWIGIVAFLYNREKKIRNWNKMKEYPANIWDICKEKVEDGPTPCRWPHCDCDGKPPEPLT